MSETTGSTLVRIVPPSIGPRTLHKYINEAKKYVLLENIHYASSEFKDELSKELHNFSDYKTKWILVGVQHKADEIFLGNRDLIGRLKELQTGIFTKDQVFEILNKGEKKLNITLSTTLSDNIFDESQGVSALAQDIAKNYCLLSGIDKTLIESRKVDFSKELFERTCSEIAQANKQVYKTFVEEIKKGGRTSDITQKYYWFLRMIKDGKLGMEGLNNTEVFSHVSKLTQIDQSGVTSGLKYLNVLQPKKSLTPPVLEYDETRQRLYLLDPYFKFVLRWTDILE
jgi:hypothetical protein